MLLRHGSAGLDAVALARQVLTASKGLRALLDYGAREFSAPQGLGPACYVTPQAALEISRRYVGAALERGPILRHAGGARAYVRAQLKPYDREVFACLFLDGRHRAVAFETLFFGPIDNTTVHPREVVKRARQLNAGAVILAHNHPSGALQPSSADLHLTKRLRDALDMVAIELIDHIIAGDTETTLLADRGLL